MHITDLLANTQRSTLESITMTDLLPTSGSSTEVVTDSRDLAIRNMLLAILQSLVDEPDKLQLLQVTMDEGVAFQVRSATSDVGKLIGKSGRTARAIRTVLSASSAKNGRRYSLDIAQ